ncbi:DNA methyltransferase [Candidatus Viridilinea mediisalina]|uniref:Methyltransferase n=1 Tax=Candidatus Viridilinea mediisalina TaxID=2024553 RepID=A0A2A6REE9_9CHLR|nr:DNA methyltransferase [Candidatus Viridilinea mediisalina]PDW01005.1 DNA methyltransferase [Candidatus Viridilinea mediisalina]
MKKNVLLLDPTTTVEKLAAIKNVANLSELKVSINKLQTELQDPHNPIHTNGSNLQAVEYDYETLNAELEQIVRSLTLDRAIYYVNRLIKSITETRTSAINDINLNRWKEYDEIITDSLWVIDRRDSSGVHTAGYWGNFIPQIPHQLMRRYTKRGDWVLDTFAGSGTTMIEGQRLGRHVLGVELQNRMVSHIKKIIVKEPNRYGATIDIIEGDSSTIDYKALLAKYGQESVQLVIMHPPYYDIIKFSEDPRDLSNAHSTEGFLSMMGAVMSNAAPILERGRYLAIVIGDKYYKGDWIPLGFQTMNAALERGFSLKSIIVKNFEDTSGKRNQKELWRYRALVGGFYIFKHEYIFLLKKQ